MSRLRLPVVHEMTGVRGGFACRPLRHVRLLRAEIDLARDPIILDAEIAANAVAVQVRPDVVVVAVEAEIAIELSVIHVTRIADVGAPDLLAGFNVARKSGDAGRRDHRRVDAATRLRVAEHDGVRVNDEEAYAGGSQQLINAGSVSTFRQPDAARLAPEMFNVILLADFDLCAAGFRARH